MERSWELGVGEWEFGVGERELGVGERELGVGERELGVGERELGVGERELGVGERELGVGERELGVSERELGVGERELGVGERELGVGERELGVSERELGVGERELGVGERELGVGEWELSESEMKDLSERAHKLTNFLWSRKRAVESRDLRERANKLEKKWKEKVEEQESNKNPASLDTRIRKKVLSELKRTTYHWTPLKYDADLALVYMLARAAHTHWGDSLKEYVCVDSSAAINSLAKRLLTGDSEGDEPLIKHVYFRQFLPVSPKVQSDLVLAAFSLSELPSQEEREETLQTLWRKTHSYLGRDRSALSPFLFAVVMDRLKDEVRQESPWTIMFVDDIVICGESSEQVEKILERWRYALERRGMKVSRSKTEFMCVNEREGSGGVRLQGEEVEKVEEFRTVTLYRSDSVTWCCRGRRFRSLKQCSGAESFLLSADERDMCSVPSAAPMHNSNN
ncbi:methyltransferase-like protein 17, mitochondrial isoform X2 [Silurus asotus]|uniref:ribonuclease H n=1 Tax=Silurus asotus TaxID=30991 RepID=A0AAD5A2Z9_SILAS|nr:methyltransferase-like protein 17, mitochondrial isoform X2 [Silurus asotus]